MEDGPTSENSWQPVSSDKLNTGCFSMRHSRQSGQKAARAAKLWPRKSSVSANSVLTGDIMMMPGLLKTLAAERIDVDEDGVITGLF